MVYYVILEDNYDYSIIYKYRNLMPKKRLEACEEFIFLEDKLKNIIAYLLIKKYIIDNKLKINDNIIYNQFGKPELVDSNQLKFSISHSKNIVAVAFSSIDIGIDVEEIQHYNENIKKFMFSYNERLKYEKEIENLHFCTRVWTKKEAYLKNIGIGIASDLSKINFDYNKKNIIYDNKSIDSYDLGESIISICHQESSMVLKKIELKSIEDFLK